MKVVNKRLPGLNFGVLKKTQIYSLYSTQVDEENTVSHFAKCFSAAAVIKNKLVDTLAYNELIFQQECQKFIFSQHFLKIKNKIKTSLGFLYLTEQYDIRLNKHIQNGHVIPQSKALFIFEHILKAVYSLYRAGYTHRNIRAQNFVQVQGVWKLQSIVCENQTDSTLQCQYLSNKAFQPPEVYENKILNDEQLNQKIVWDLGCILIHLLMGNHKLKSFKILKKFQNQPFSFQKIDVKISDKFSSRTKQYLGKMCHYDAKKRMTLQELFGCQYFSQQVAHSYKKVSSMLKKGQQNNPSVSHIFSINGQKSKNKKKEEKGKEKKEQKVKEENDEDEYEKINNPYAKEDQTPTNNGKKYESQLKQFNDQMQPLNQQKQIPKFQEYDQSKVKIFVSGSDKINHYHNSSLFINLNDSLRIDPRLSELYRSEVDRCEIMIMEKWQFIEIVNYFKERNLNGDGITYAIKYCLLFVNCMMLKDMDQQNFLETKFYDTVLKDYDIKKEHIIEYKNDKEYKDQQKKIKLLRKESTKELFLIRDLLLEMRPERVMDEPRLFDFMFCQDPEKATYAQIKDVYRDYLYNALLKVVLIEYKKHSHPKKERDWIQIVMHATYWMAFNKLYLSESIKESFQDYFKWIQEKPSYYINSKKYLGYLNQIPEHKLYSMSVEIIDKYFDFGQKQ